MAKLILDTAEVKTPTLVLDESPDVKLEEDVSASPTLVEDKPSVFETAKQKLSELDKKMAGEYDPDEAEAWGKMSKLNKTLDIMGRPGQAVKASIQGEWEKNREIADKIRAKYGDTGEGIILSTDTANKMKAEIREAVTQRKGDIRDNLSAAYRGLTGKERHTGNEQLKMMGIEGIPLAGFTYEIITDPLMYGGYSAITKVVGKGTSAVSKAAMTVPEIAETVTVGKALVKPVVDLFTTKSRIPELNEMITKWTSQRQFLKGTAMKYALQTELAVRSIARKSGMTTEEVGKRAANIISLRNYPEELAKVVPNILPEERVFANVMQSHYSNMIVDEMKKGVPINPLNYANDTKVAKLRKNLDVIRVAHGTDLAKTRGNLVRELDMYGDEKLAQYTAKLNTAKDKLEAEAHKTNLVNIKRINGTIDSVDKQMTQLELLKVKAIKDQAPRVIKELDKKLATLENQYWYLHSEMAERLQGVPELATGSKYVKQIDEISKLLADDIEVNLGTHGTSIGKQIVAKEARMGKLPQTDIGIPIGESRKLLKQLTVDRAKKEFGYFPRLTSDEANALFKSVKIGKSRVWNTKMANSLKQHTGDWTIDEVNAFAKTHGLKSLDGKTVEQLFLTDPAYAVAVRGTRGAKAITSAEFLKEAGNKFGRPIMEAPANWRPLPESAVKLNQYLKGLAFPEEVASEIGRISEYYLNPSSRPDLWGNFAKHFDQVQNVWKRYQLAIFPKYHLRNMVGNMWNVYLAGGDPQYYPKMAALQAYNKYRGTPQYAELARKGLKTLGISVDDANKLLSDMDQLGVISHGQYSADIDQSIRQALGNKSVMDKGMAVGNTIENNAKGALYLDGVLKRGLSPEQAAMRSKKFLIDYSDYTSFERNVMKRLAPFYMWTSRNIPIQLEALWKTPEKFAPIAIPLRNREPLDLLRLKYGNPQLYGSLPVELHRTVDTVTYVPLDGLLPAADIAKITRPGEMLWELFSPFPKEVIQQSLNRDIYSGSDIQTSRGQTKQYLNMELPVRVVHLLNTVSPSARITREIDKMVTKQKNKLPLTIDEQIFANTLSTVYKSKLKDLRVRAIKRVAGQLQELYAALGNAKRNKREGAVKLIKKEIDNVKKELKGVR